MSNQRQNEWTVEDVSDDASLESISDDENPRGDPKMFLAYLV